VERTPDGPVFGPERTRARFDLSEAENVARAMLEAGEALDLEIIAEPNPMFLG
jgi:hypothetical protein